MEIKNVIGIDVSKLTLDLCLLTRDGECEFYQCANDAKEIIGLFNNLFSSHNLSKEETLLCAEYTGHYGNRLTEAVLLKGYSFWLENPAQIKNSQGVQRGKDDRKDAERIACYARRFADKAVLLQPAAPIYTHLAYLCAERNLLLVDAAKYKAQLKDESSFIHKDLFKAKQRRYKSVIRQLEKAIEEIETEIDQTINNDACCKAQFDLLTSIDGIGRQVAVHTLIETKGFTRFKDARKFACHAGVAPFKYWSGSSIRSAHKVSHRANKKLKQLLHMAALSVIRMKGELQDYYKRKVAEGKNKMTVINAVRAKLIARMFAVISRNQNYQKNYSIMLV
jgi:transposase